jgi:hypothetical protein
MQRVVVENQIIFFRIAFNFTRNPDVEQVLSCFRYTEIIKIGG